MTALQELIEFLKETYTETIGEPAIRKATELLETEKTQIVEAHVAITKAGLIYEENYTYTEDDERLIRQQAETYFNQTYKQ